jgi:hypothetical protein
MGLGDIFKMASPLLGMIPGVGPLASVVLGGLGGALGNRAQTSNQTSTTHGVQNVDNLTRPEYDPKSQLLRDHLINAYMSNLEGNDDFFSGYTNQGLSNINASTDAATRQIQNVLANRGIQGPMAGAGLSAPLLASMGQKSNLLNSIPMLQDQRRQSILKDTSGFLSSLPIGQHTTGTTTSDSTTKGTQTTPSNMLAGMFQGAGSTLAGLYGSGAFRKDGPVTGMPEGSYNSNPQIDWGTSQAPQTPIAPPPMYPTQSWPDKIYKPSLPY